MKNLYISRKWRLFLKTVKYLKNEKKNNLLRHLFYFQRWKNYFGFDREVGYVHGNESIWKSSEQSWNEFCLKIPECHGFSFYNETCHAYNKWNQQYTFFQREIVYTKKNLKVWQSLLNMKYIQIF